MGFLKYAIVFVTLFACACSINMEWGYRRDLDCLLFTQSISRPALNTAQEVDVVYPQSGVGNTRTISAIRVIDNSNSADPIATLWSGGLNQRNVIIKVESHHGQPMNVTIQIFGN